MQTVKLIDADGNQVALVNAPTDDKGEILKIKCITYKHRFFYPETVGHAGHLPVVPYREAMGFDATPPGGA